MTVAHLRGRMACRYSSALGLLVLIGLLRADERLATNTEAVYSRGVVAADHPLASEAGAEILRQGGNVVDAAVATSFALSVVRPESCGLGGGGFMVIWNAESRTAVALDYRERAPLAAQERMFVPAVDADESAVPDSRHGGLAIGIPGNVAGLCYALEHYGSLDLPTVLAPAIRLAQQPIDVDATARSSQNAAITDLRTLGPDSERFTALRDLYLNGGHRWTQEDRFDSPLEDALRRIARDGPAGFYRGDVGQALLTEVQRQGGIWTAADLQPDKLVVEREPLRMAYGDAEVLAMPPPSSGGIAMIEVLQILSALDAIHPDAQLTTLRHNSPQYVHRLAEASKHAFADRAAYLGDADFVDVPIQRLTSPVYATRLAEKFRLHSSLPSSSYGRSMLKDDAGTSHLSVIDARGNAVACTETINTTYGSYVVEPRFGIILNNEMDDFTARPGEPNAFGLIQSQRNAVAPGKKPLSSMSPTIVIRNGQAEMAVGASGGPKIISGTLQVLINVTQFEMSPSEAVAAPRLHHQWQPNTLQVEEPLFGTVSAELRMYGHEVAKISGVGVVQAATRDSHGLRAASDTRKGGRPAGW